MEIKAEEISQIIEQGLVNPVVQLDPQPNAQGHQRGQDQHRYPDVDAVVGGHHHRVAAQHQELALGVDRDLALLGILLVTLVTPMAAIASPARALALPRRGGAAAEARGPAGDADP